ncbi:MAG: hypothetical protein PHO30_00090 [Candidatus Omnitrophica bacterium]|nr:hypothetical protein [Candidatus Omnitrophota bacterium]
MKNIICLKKVDGQWMILMNYVLFEVSIVFLKGMPRLSCLINYADWKRLLIKMLIQKKNHSQRKKEGKILQKIGRDICYISDKPLEILLPSDELESKNNFKLTKEDKKTGMSKYIAVEISNVTIHFHRNMFVKFRDALLDANQVLEKRLEILTGNKECKRAMIKKIEEGKVKQVVVRGNIIKNNY